MKHGGLQPSASKEPGMPTSRKAQYFDAISQVNKLKPGLKIVTVRQSRL